MSEELTQFERTGNPFPGLRPFETEEYNLFFGREGQSDELLARLGRTRFLAVVGTSGSGKSSLIRAGLLPALYGGLMAGTGSGWRIAVMRPGHDPLGNLARALAEDSVLGSPGVDDAVEASIVETTLRRSTLGLVDAARQARLPAGENVLVVVDQFEELFRFRSMRDQQGTDDEAAAFVKLLLEAPRQREVPVYVVLTMRSDFLGDCSQFQGLPEAINDGQYLIPRMTRDERRMAITGPAVVGGGEMSPPLVNRLLNDVGDNPDQLPILQHALMRTWEHWGAHRRDGEAVGLDDYLAVGTMSDALSLHADEAWGELKDERGRHVAEALFKALTERGADNREVRRPTRLREVCEITGAGPAEVAAVVEVFRREGRSFLMPPAGTALEPETVIDISHESLIRNWVRLREWVKEEAESARIYRRLADAAAAHRAGEGGLLDDVTLGWVNRWRDKYQPNRAWGVRYHPGYDEALAYLAESQASSDARIAAEGERERRELEQARAYAEQQRSAARRLRLLLAGMAIMFLLSLGTAAYAFRMSRVAEGREREARAAQAAAQQAAEAERATASRLAEEKLQKEKAAEGLRIEQEKTAKALKAVQAAVAEQQRALVAQRKAAAEARRQTVAAKTAEDVANKALIAAEENAERRAEAAGRNAQHLLGIASLQRQDYETALKQFNDVLGRLDDEEKSPLPSRDIERIMESSRRSYERGSVLTHKGEALRKLGNRPEARTAYDKAVSSQREMLRHLNEIEGGPAAGDKEQRADLTLALFDAVHGLAHAYRDFATEAKKLASPTDAPAASDADVDAQDAADGARKSYAASEKYFKEALDIQKSVYEDKSPSALAAGYENLARLYRDLGRFDDAEPLYDQIVELRERQNPYGPETLSALKERAQFYAGQNNRTGYEKALSAYEKLLTAQEGLGGEDEFPAWADTISEMGEVYLGLGNEPDSEASFRLARLLQGIGLKFKQMNRAGSVSADGGKRTIDMFHSSNAGKDMEEAADLFAQLRMDKKAIEFYRILAGVKESSGDPNGAAGIMLKTAKVARDHLNDKETALSNYRYAVQILRDTPDANPALLAEALTGVGRLNSEEAGTADSAKGYYDQALDVLSKAPGYERETYATLSAEADLYKRRGKNDELVAVSRRKLAVASELLERNSPNSPAQKAWDARAYTEAFGLYTRAVKDLSEAFAAKGDKTATGEVFAELLDPRLEVGKVLDANVVASYTEALEGHRDVLARMVRPPAASRNYDAQVKEAQSRQEELYQIRGPCPYLVNVTTPGSVREGNVVTFAANTNYGGGRSLRFTWTTDSPGVKIEQGQGTPDVMVDTAGLGGKSVTLNVAVDDGSGVAACRQTAAVTLEVRSRRRPPNDAPSQQAPPRK